MNTETDRIGRWIGQLAAALEAGGRGELVPFNSAAIVLNDIDPERTGIGDPASVACLTVPVRRQYMRHPAGTGL